MSLSEGSVNKKIVIMTINSGEVYILKAQSGEDNANYLKLLEGNGLSPKIIPVLDFEFCDLTNLKNLLDRPQDFSGIIFTSPRAVDAIVQSLCFVKNLAPEWRDLPMFVVGESTKKSLLSQLGLIGKSGVTENAVGLADLIVKNSYDRPLLFPCSDMRRETLPTLLSQKGILLKEITVYRTRAHPLLEETLKNATLQGTAFPEFMVFFSPSGVKYALPILSQIKVPFVNMKVVAIGGTTESALREANISVWSCSAKPNPNDLLRALVKSL